MSPGKGDYRRCIFIAGTFSKYPSLILWDESVETGPTVTAIGASGELYGLFTGVSQVTVGVIMVHHLTLIRTLLVSMAMPDPPTPAPAPALTEPPKMGLSVDEKFKGRIRCG